ncbi:MAG: hypothetical protein K7J15_01365, partial [Candidatus Regiella insecticola]|nr:hypothetical protein [Candidatus Regiella insecticola]
LLRDTDPALPGAGNPHVLMAMKIAVRPAPWLRITRYGFERNLMNLIKSKYSSRQKKPLK